MCESKDLSVTVRNQRGCQLPLCSDDETVDDKSIDGSPVESAATDNETDDWEDDKPSLRSEYDDREEVSTSDSPETSAEKAGPGADSAETVSELPLQASSVSNSKAVGTQPRCDHQSDEEMETTDSGRRELVTKSQCGDYRGQADDKNSSSECDYRVRCRDSENLPFVESAVGHGKAPDKGETNKIDSLPECDVNLSCYNGNTLQKDAPGKITSVEPKCEQLVADPQNVPQGEEGFHTRCQHCNSDVPAADEMHRKLKEMERKMKHQSSVYRLEKLEWESKLEELQLLQKEKAELARELKMTQENLGTAIAERDQAADEAVIATREQDRAIELQKEAIMDRDKAVKSEDQFRKQLEWKTKQQGKTKKQQDKAAKERDEAIKQRGKLVKERDTAVKQRDKAVKEQTEVRKQVKKLTKQSDKTVKERDEATEHQYRAETELNRVRIGCGKICLDIPEELEERKETLLDIEDHKEESEVEQTLILPSAMAEDDRRPLKHQSSWMPPVKEEIEMAPNSVAKETARWRLHEGPPHQHSHHNTPCVFNVMPWRLPARWCPYIPHVPMTTFGGGPIAQETGPLLVPDVQKLALPQGHVAQDGLSLGITKSYWDDPLCDRSDPSVSDGYNDNVGVMNVEPTAGHHHGAEADYAWNLDGKMNWTQDKVVWECHGGHYPGEDPGGSSQTLNNLD